MLRSPGGYVLDHGAALQPMPFGIEEHSSERGAKANCEPKQNIDTWLNRCLSRLSAWPTSLCWSRALKWKARIPPFLVTFQDASSLMPTRNLSSCRDALCNPKRHRYILLMPTAVLILPLSITFDIFVIVITDTSLLCYRKRTLRSRAQTENWGEKNQQYFNSISLPTPT